MSRPVNEEDVQAYVDGRLEGARREDVERYLDEQPHEAARVKDYQAQRETLAAALAFHDPAPVPPRLDLLRLLDARMFRRRTMWRAAAAIVLSVGIGGAAGWLSRGGLPTGLAGRAMAVLTRQAVASQAVYAVDRLHPIEVGAGQREHLAVWLSNRLQHPLQPPDLVSAGYELLGGRLLATETGGPAALFMYADKEGRRISVLLRPMAPGISAKRQDAQTGPMGVCAWIKAGLGYAVAGPLPDEQLDRLADLVMASARGPS